MASSVVVFTVEDNPLVQEHLRTALSEAGYGVEAAYGADEAEERFGDPNFQPKALVIDVVLKGKSSGWDVARLARQRNPEIAIVYVTARATEEWPSHGVPNSILITKPFVEAQVVTAVSQLLVTKSTPQS